MVKKQKSRNFNSEISRQAPPTYEELNAFMSPSLLSPKYEHPNDNLNNYPESPDSPVSHKSATSYKNYNTSENSESENNSDINSEDESKCSVSYKKDGSYATNTSSKDLKLYDMKCLLDKKRKNIYEKNREIRELATDNPYLSSVVSDYNNVQGTVLEEKKNQEKALKILSKHIRNISKQIKYDDFQLQRIREDQQILLDEIDKLRKDISYIHNKIDGDTSSTKGKKHSKKQYDNESDSFSSDYASSENSSDE